MNHTIQILEKEKKELVDKAKRIGKMVDLHSRMTKKSYEEYIKVEEKIMNIEENINDIKKNPSN